MSLATKPFAPQAISLRLYPHQMEPGAALDELQRQSQMAVAAGFDGVMLSERHGGAWGQIPSPLQVCGWLLAAMPSGWAAPCPMLLPFRPPPIVAEEAAWLAARYAGRVGVGFAAGGNEADFVAHDIPFEERNARFDAHLRRVVALLTGGDGEEKLAADPAVAQCRRDGLPMVSAAMSKPAARRAAELGLGIIGTSLLPAVALRGIADAYRTAGGGGPHVMIRHIWIGKPPTDALQRQQQEYRRVASQRQGAAFGDEVIASDDGGEIGERLLAGMTDAAADALNIRVHVRGVEPTIIREQIAGVGSEVLPRVRAGLQGQAVPS